MPISKRTISFKPESDVKIALIEILALTEVLGLDLTADEIINAALKNYLPPLLATLKENLTSKEQETLFSVLTEAQSYLSKGFLPEEGSEDQGIDKNHEEETLIQADEIPEEPAKESQEEPEESNTVNPDLLNKFLF